MPSVDPDELSEEDASNYEPSPQPVRGKYESMENMPYDEAIELSTDSHESFRAEEKHEDREASGAKAASPGGDNRGADAKGQSGLLKSEEKLTNNLFDEACDLDDDEESVDTTEGLIRQREAAAAAAKKQQPAQLQAEAKQSTSSKQAGRPPAPTAKPARSPGGDSSDGSDEDEDEEDEEESAGDEEEENANGANSGTTSPTPIEGAYNPKDYADLNVSADVRDLFPYIGRYNAHEVELDSTLKCFIPDYIPAVGEMDAFIKVPRPDNERDLLGLTALDEPAAAQSDATVLELQLRAVSKKQHGDVAVRSIDNAAKNPLEIERWITSIAELHRARPPPQVNYRKSMPDIDKLMEEWPPEFEDLLRENNITLPTADLEASLPEFARIACGIMDIPVYDNVVESLHVLFSLYLEFSDNVHFANMNNQNNNNGSFNSNSSDQPISP